MHDCIMLDLVSIGFHDCPLAVHSYVQLSSNSNRQFNAWPTLQNVDEALVFISPNIWALTRPNLMIGYVKSHPVSMIFQGKCSWELYSLGWWAACICVRAFESSVFWHYHVMIKEEEEGEVHQSLSKKIYIHGRHIERWVSRIATSFEHRRASQQLQHPHSSQSSKSRVNTSAPSRSPSMPHVYDANFSENLWWWRQSCQ